MRCVWLYQWTLAGEEMIRRCKENALTLGRISTGKPNTGNMSPNYEPYGSAERVLTDTQRLGDT